MKVELMTEKIFKTKLTSPNAMRGRGWWKKKGIQIQTYTKRSSKVKSSSDKKNKELTMSMFDGKSKEKDIINKPIKTTHSKPKKATKPR